MKLSALFIFFIFLFYSCKKEQPIKPVSIVGIWRWIDTYQDIPLGPTNPLTPQNTGIQELLIFNSDLSWKKDQNNIIIDSGTYSLGRGYYSPYSGTDFTYDSIQYFKNGTPINIGDYYSINNDTLSFNPYLSGHLSSYTLPIGGTKWWVKQ